MEQNKRIVNLFGNNAGSSTVKEEKELSEEEMYQKKIREEELIDQKWKRGQAQRNKEYKEHREKVESSYEYKEMLKLKSESPQQTSLFTISSGRKDGNTSGQKESLNTKVEQPQSKKSKLSLKGQRMISDFTTASQKPLGYLKKSLDKGKDVFKSDNVEDNIDLDDISTDTKFVDNEIKIESKQFVSVKPSSSSKSFVETSNVVQNLENIVSPVKDEKKMEIDIETEASDTFSFLQNVNSQDWTDVYDIEDLAKAADDTCIKMEEIAVNVKSTDATFIQMDKTALKETRSSSTDVDVTTLRLGSTAPSWVAHGILNGSKLKEISSIDYNDKYHVILFYNFDVSGLLCPKEIRDYHTFSADFKKLGCSIIAIANIHLKTHLKWIKSKRVDGGYECEPDIILIYDEDESIAKNYGINYNVKFPEGKITRGLFIINKQQRIRMIFMHDYYIEHDPKDTLWKIKALQKSDEESYRMTSSS